LKLLPGDLAGTYLPLDKIEGEHKEALLKANFLLPPVNKNLEAIGFSKDWPTGRGVFFNKDMNFFVWINREE
jgi:hypothetical protein